MCTVILNVYCYIKCVLLCTLNVLYYVYVLSVPLGNLLTVLLCVYNNGVSASLQRDARLWLKVSQGAL